jgi:glycosyltransferase involved in cell wall biosynthesis
MSLTALNVAYPFAPVRPDAAGGAEQIVAALDRGLVAAGCRSLVLACAGSQTLGELTTLEVATDAIDEPARADAWARWRAVIAELQRRHAPDVTHLHGIDFAHYLPSAGRTVVTLHLPLDWYAPSALAAARADLHLHGVSASQCARAPAQARLGEPIANGVDLDALRPGGAKHGYALWLGRICPEKGAHFAIEAAQRAGVPLLLAGHAFGYEAHRRYFAEEVAPRLGPRARFVGAVGGVRKRRLLAGARCLLLPSLAEETSSLVAMEALACGTPVVAFRRGALPELIDHGRTGYLVDDVEAMAQAVAACASLSGALCRAEAERRFPQSLMVARYLALYRDMLRRFPCSTAA